jgi:hypothetical protein
MFFRQGFIGKSETMRDLKKIRDKIGGFRATIVFALLGIVCLQIPAFGQGRPISFSLQKLDGGTLTSDSLAGKVVVLALGGKNNPLDLSLLPQLQRLSDRYQNRGVVVIWVASDSAKAGARNYASDQDIRSFVGRAKFSGIVVRDPDASLLRSVGANQMPTIVLVDKKGGISMPLVIGFDPDSQDAVTELSARIDKLLP